MYRLMRINFCVSTYRGWRRCRRCGCAGFEQLDCHCLIPLVSIAAHPESIATEGDVAACSRWDGTACFTHIDEGVLTYFCSLLNADEGGLCRNTVCRTIWHTRRETQPIATGQQAAAAALQPETLCW